MEDKAKIERCKYSHPHFKNNSIEYHCVVDGWEDDKVRICKKGECESCQKFKSKYVEYPITVHEIENKPIDTSGLGHEEDHIQLLETIVHCSAQIMISGYDTPLYNDYLHTWDTLRIPNQTTSGVVREEIVWMNYTHQLSLYDFGIL